MKTTLLLLAGSLALGAAEFPAPYNSEPGDSKPMPPNEAAAKMQLPPGFKATVFAAEPDVQNPIAMAWDSRGRLWVAENYTYAESGKKFDLNLRDRILIFEDKDGDGRFDTRKVFMDDLQMLTSIEIGHGGVWVMCPPQLLSFLIAMETTFRMGRQKSSSTALRARRTCIILLQMACALVRMAGFTAGAAHQAQARWASRNSCGPKDSPPWHDVAVSPEASGGGGAQFGHNQSMGTRLERARRTLLH